MARTKERIRTALSGPALGWSVAALIVIAVPWVTGDFGLSLAVAGALLALAALPLTVLTGTAGLLSLGHAAFLGIGGYTAGILAHVYGIGLSVSLFAAAACGLLVGSLVALATLRAVGIYLAVGTFALHFVLQPVLQNIDVAVTYSTGFLLSDASLFGFSLSSHTRWWYALAVIGALLYLWLHGLQRSQVGRRWVALRDTPTAAGVLGVSLQGTRMGVFALTSALTSAVGALQAYYYGSAQAGIYSLHVAILYLTIVALGGAGNLLGAVVASFIMILLAPAVASVIEGTQLLPPSAAGGIETILVGLILMLSLIVRARIKLKEEGDE